MTQWATFFHLKIALLGTFVHWRLRLQLVVPNLCVKPCLASFAPVYTRNPTQILHIVSEVPQSRGRTLTNAMSARSLPITFCSELVALITGSADSPADGS